LSELSTELPTELAWHWRRFDALSAGELYDWLALRAAVFVVEQDCVYLDLDGLDHRAWHLMGRDAAGVLQAGLRLLDPGIKYAEPSIGRVITAPGWRGLGGGRVLMRQGLAQCNQLWPDQAVRISAQAHLQRFYASLGFDPVGDPYLEDGIPHVEMMRVPPVRA